MDSAVQGFFQVKQHFRGRPSEFEAGAQERIQAWEKALHKLVYKLEPILLRLRDSALRARLTEITGFLVWPEISDAQLGGSPAIIGELCDHALECLGNVLRDEPLPSEGTGLIRAHHVQAQLDAYMEEEAREWEALHGPGTF
jgi:hypothetical protein